MFDALVNDNAIKVCCTNFEWIRRNVSAISSESMTKLPACVKYLRDVNFIFTNCFLDILGLTFLELHNFLTSLITD